MLLMYRNILLIIPPTVVMPEISGKICRDGGGLTISPITQEMILIRNQLSGVRPEIQNLKGMFSAQIMV